jgi:hypothetical protein
MNTINHYVGMYPIDTGSPVELRLSKFIFGWFAVMLLGFMATQRKHRCDTGCGLRRGGRLDGRRPARPGQLDSFAAHYYHEAKHLLQPARRAQGLESQPALATKMSMAGMVVAMAIILPASGKSHSFQLLLALVPAMLPVFFVIDYAGWLWFFGHNMHPWGAFTVKPFMPTVFGEGKVAQFSTFSYPYWGYALLLLASCCLMMALLLRRRQMRDSADG